MRENISNREEEILTEIININKIEAFSGEEILRARYIQKLMTKFGLNAVIDAVGNVEAKIEGKNKNSAIVICANLDSVRKNEDIIKLTGTELIGKDIVRTALPLFTLAILADIVKEIEFNNNIIFVATSESETTQKGIKKIVDNSNEKIKGIINIEGSSFGNISTLQESIVRLKVDFKYDEAINTKSVPIFALANFINKLREEELGENIIFKVIELNSGSTNSRYNDKSYIRIEISSNTLEELKTSIKVIKSICVMVSKEEKMLVEVKEEYSREARKMENSKLEYCFVSMADELRINTQKVAYNNEIIYGQTKGIDSVNIGMVSAGKIGSPEEYFEINSFYKGFELLYKSLLKIDRELI